MRSYPGLPAILGTVLLGFGAGFATGDERPIVRYPRRRQRAASLYEPMDDADRRATLPLAPPAPLTKRQRRRARGKARGAK